MAYLKSTNYYYQCCDLCVSCCYVVLCCVEENWNPAWCDEGAKFTALLLHQHFCLFTQSTRFIFLCEFGFLYFFPFFPWGALVFVETTRMLYCFGFVLDRFLIWIINVLDFGLFFFYIGVGAWWCWWYLRVGLSLSICVLNF